MNDEPLIDTRTLERKTLRDEFAMHAPTPQFPMTLEEHCAYRYRYADAMMQERAK